MPILMNSCDILSHTVPFLNSGLFPKNILFCSRMFFWTYRERMTQVMFETFNVPVTFVTIQPVSVHLETRRPSCWTLATLCRTQLLSTSLHIASAILRLYPRYLTKYLMKFLTERGYSFSEREIVRDVKDNLQSPQRKVPARRRPAGFQMATPSLSAPNASVAQKSCADSSPHTLVSSPSLRVRREPFLRAPPVVAL